MSECERSLNTSIYSRGEGRLGGNIRRPTNMPFKFDSQHFFLTYPQSDFTNDELIAAINAIAELEWIRVCREQHQDGNLHSHAVGRFKRRFQTRNPRCFDVAGRHPKVESVRSVRKALDYVSKDGEYTDSGPVPSQQTRRSWTDIVEAAKGDETEWLRTVHEERMGPHVAKRLRELSTSESVDLAEYDQRPISESLSIVPLTFKSLLVVGIPGIGKTGWAMLHMPRPCLLVKHVDTLRSFRPGYHQSIFFDDCDFKHYPRATQLQLCDYENQCQIHVRYGVAVIPAKIPRLFCSNFSCEPFIVDTAIQGRRLETIYIVV